MRCELIGYAQSPTFGLDAGIELLGPAEARHHGHRHWDYGVSSPSRMRIGMDIATTAMPGTDPSPRKGGVRRVYRARSDITA